VLLNGKDVTWLIRNEEVEQNVSPVSAFPGVRSALTEQQRIIGKRGKMVMAGRDIGTVVFPRAELKVFLDASLEERARRRHEENKARGEKSDYGQILNSLKKGMRSTHTEKSLHWYPRRMQLSSIQII